MHPNSLDSRVSLLLSSYFIGTGDSKISIRLVKIACSVSVSTLLSAVWFRLYLIMMNMFNVACETVRDTTEIGKEVQLVTHIKSF